jgi:hypothetical protein
MRPASATAAPAACRKGVVSLDPGGDLREESYDDLLSADPRAALAQVGLRVPAGAEVAVVRTGPSPPDLRIQLSLWTDAAGSNRFVLHVPPLDARTLAWGRARPCRRRSEPR